jgi:hypothetical protein
MLTQSACSLADMTILTQNTFFKPCDNSNPECFKSALLLKQNFEWYFFQAIKIHDLLCDVI